MDNYISMFSLVMPGVVYLIFNVILVMTNENKYLQLLCDGMVLLPKDDTFVSWTYYLSTAIFFIVIFKMICELYLNYNHLLVP